MFQDKLIGKLMIPMPLKACFDLVASVRNTEKLTMAPLIFYLCRLLGETQELRSESEFFEQMERFLTWLKDLLK